MNRGWRRVVVGSVVGVLAAGLAFGRGGATRHLGLPWANDDRTNQALQILDELVVWQDPQTHLVHYPAPTPAPQLGTVAVDALQLTTTGSKTLLAIFQGSGSLAYGSMTDQCGDNTLTVPGVSAGDFVIPQHTIGASPGNVWVTAWVLTSDLVNVRVCVHGTINIGTAAIRVAVLHVS